MPGGRYYTLCHDAVGNDNHTLVHEMLAYVDPIKGGVVFDVVDGYSGIGFRGQPVAPEQFISFRANLLREPCKRLNPGVLDLWRKVLSGSVQGEQLPEITTIVMGLPYEVAYTTVPNVLDLRLKSAQEWLLESYVRKPHAFLKKEGRERISDFVELLPTLLDLRLGGNVVTDSLANFLTAVGVSGLIFPSARLNSSVRYQQGRVVDWKGWNFVDYRNIDTGVQTFSDFKKGWRTDLRTNASILHMANTDAKGSWSTHGIAEFTTEVANWSMKAFMNGINYHDLIAKARGA